MFINIYETHKDEALSRYIITLGESMSPFQIQKFQIVN